MLSKTICIALLWCNVGLAQEISLEDMWAWHMPGTNDVCSLEPTVFGEWIKKLPDDKRNKIESESLVNQIQIGLGHHSPADPALSGFVVPGTGAAALSEAYQVLCKEQKPKESFPSGHELSLIFFSHSFGKYVELLHADRDNDVIHVTYRFVSHADMNLTTHFAIIPLGTLPTGTFKVDIIQAPQEGLDAKGVSNEEASHFISRPFSFTVTQ
jgi:hypothetical protein